MHCKFRTFDSLSLFRYIYLISYGTVHSAQFHIDIETIQQVGVYLVSIEHTHTMYKYIWAHVSIPHMSEERKEKKITRIQRFGYTPTPVCICAEGCLSRYITNMTNMLNKL